MGPRRDCILAITQRNFKTKYKTATIIKISTTTAISIILPIRIAKGINAAISISLLIIKIAQVKCQANSVLNWTILATLAYKSIDISPLVSMELKQKQE